MSRGSDDASAPADRSARSTARSYVERRRWRPAEQIEARSTGAVAAAAALGSDVPSTERRGRLPAHGRVDGRARRRDRRRADAGRWAGRSRTRPGEIRRGFQERARYMARSRRRAGRHRRRRRRRASSASSAASRSASCWCWRRGTTRTSARSTPSCRRCWPATPSILKVAQQTPLVAERYAEAFAAAGLPDGVFQYVARRPRRGRRA